MIKKSSNEDAIDTRASRKKLKEFNKKLAIKLINKHFPEAKNQKIKYKDVHNGYTNFSFLVTFEDGNRYQVRIPHDNNIINRNLEYDILFNYLKTNDFIYYDQKTGIAIKKWLTLKNPGKRIYFSHKFNESLFKEIKMIHRLPLKKGHKFEPIKFDKYNLNLYRLKFAYKKKFLCLMDRRSNDPLVLNHTDVNPLNILYDAPTGKLKLIDFEWVGLASDYFDYANYVREAKINYKSIDWSKYIENFDMSIFEQYLFMCSVYSYLWTFAMPQTHKINKYRIKALKQIRKYYPAVINVDKSCYITDKKEHEEE